MAAVLVATLLVGVMVILLVLLARGYPGSGADLLDWKPTRDYETEIELELEDVEQMLAAQNAYRRKRGVAELTEADAHRMAAEDEAVRERARMALDDRLERGAAAKAIEPTGPDGDA